MLFFSRQVIKHQKAEKRMEAIRVLTSLQFFMDKAEKLSSISGGIAEVQARDVSQAFNAISQVIRPFAPRYREILNVLALSCMVSSLVFLMEMRQDAHSRQMLGELRTLFDTYDVDKSGEIDKMELGDLLATMGQPKSDQELARLFNLMDADGSGDVDFKEFATVILHNRNCKHSLDSADLARRMWKFFDKDGDGSISPDEMLDTFSTIIPLAHVLSFSCVDLPSPDLMVLLFYRAAGQQLGHG